MDTFGARYLTRGASYAFIWIEKQLGSVPLRFGVVAPRAAQGTPLKKDGCTNTRTVAHTKAL